MNRPVHLFGALRWSVAAELASRIGPPLLLLLLAQLLLPEDFGVVAAGTMVVSFAQVIWGIGLGQAVIRERERLQEAASMVFWIQLGLAAIAALALVAAADVIAAVVFQDARVAAVLRASSLSIVLTAAVAVPVALMQRALRFRPIFWIQLVTGLVPVLAAVPMAFAGLGYWSLVIGSIAGQALGVLATWRAAHWRPLRPAAFPEGGRLLRFGAWASLSALLGWGFLWADAFTVALYLGAHELGLYRTGSQLVATAYGVVFSPLLPVLYSHLSAVHQDPVRLRMAFDRSLRAIAIVAIPMSFAMAAAAAPIESFLLGERWQGIGHVIALLSIAHGLAWLVGANAEAYRAVGRPELETAAMALGLALYIPVYLISVRQGLAEFVWARCGLVFWGIAVHVYFARRALGQRAGSWIAFASLAALASSPLLLLLAVDWGRGAGLIALQLGAAVLLFGVLMRWFVGRHGAEEFRLLTSVLGWPGAKT